MSAGPAAYASGNLVDYALDYRRRLGLSVFPVCGTLEHRHRTTDGQLVKCADPGKVPLVAWKQYQDEPPTEDEIRAMWRRQPDANIGMPTGHLNRVVVVDLDGDLAARLAADRGYDNGPHAFTGRVGGVHRFFAWRPDAPRNFTRRDGIDYRGEGGFVVLPPSRHALGRTYKWGEELLDLDDLPALPEWIDAMASGGDEQRRSERVARGGTDDEVIREPGRNDRLASIGGALRRYGATEASILATLLGINARQCVPPLDEPEVHKIAHSVARYAPEPDDMPRVRINGRAPVEPPRQLNYMTAAALEHAEDEEVTWFAYGLAAAGLVTELDGKVKQAGKTTLLLAMVRAIQSGDSFLGSPTTYTPVMYLSEQSKTSLKRNVGRAGLLGCENLHLLLWADTRGWAWPALIDNVYERMLAVGARLLVIDTLGQFSGIRGDGENKSGQAMEAMEPLQMLAAAGIAVLVSRHDRKSGGDVGDSGRGSSAYAGTADVVLHLQRVEEQRPGTERQRVLAGLSRFEETPEKLLIELTSREPYAYTALGDVADVRDRKLRIEILSCAPTSRDEAIAERDLQELVEGRAIDFRRVLRRLVQEHEMFRIGLGKPHDPYRYYQRAWDVRDAQND